MSVTVGQTVFLEPIGNNLIRSKEIQQGEITKIGRTYLHVKTPLGEIQFYLLDNLEKDSPRNWALHFSEQEITDKKEAIRLWRQIRPCFECRVEKDLTLGQLQKIAVILGVI